MQGNHLWWRQCYLTETLNTSLDISKVLKGNKELKEIRETMYKKGDSIKQYCFVLFLKTEIIAINNHCGGSTGDLSQEKKETAKFKIEQLKVSIWRAREKKKKD